MVPDRAPRVDLSLLGLIKGAVSCDRAIAACRDFHAARPRYLEGTAQSPPAYNAGTSVCGPFGPGTPASRGTRHLSRGTSPFRVVVFASGPSRRRLGDGKGNLMPIVIFA